jgi:UDP-2-acetamido-2-deoxy-ribo-hexuluronate aminotransferase
MDPAVLSCTRDQLCKDLGALGVPTAIHYPKTLPQQPAFKNQIAGQAAWPVAERFTQTVFCLPMHSFLTDAHFGTIESALRTVATRYAR